MQNKDREAKDALNVLSGSRDGDKNKISQQLEKLASALSTRSADSTDDSGPAALLGRFNLSSLARAPAAGSAEEQMSKVLAFADIPGTFLTPLAKFPFAMFKNAMLETAVATDRLNTLLANFDQAQPGDAERIVTGYQDRVFTPRPCLLFWPNITLQRFWRIRSKNA
jgi:hypothetical protein